MMMSLLFYYCRFRFTVARYYGVPRHTISFPMMFSAFVLGSSAIPLSVCLRLRGRLHLSFCLHVLAFPRPAIHSQSSRSQVFSRPLRGVNLCHLDFIKFKAFDGVASLITYPVKGGCSTEASIEAREAP